MQLLETSKWGNSSLFSSEASTTTYFQVIWKQYHSFVESIVCLCSVFICSLCSAKPNHYVVKRHLCFDHEELLFSRMLCIFLHFIWIDELQYCVCWLFFSAAIAHSKGGASAPISLDEDWHWTCLLQNGCNLLKPSFLQSSAMEVVCSFRKL